MATPTQLPGNFPDIEMVGTTSQHQLDVIIDLDGEEKRVRHQGPTDPMGDRGNLICKIVGNLRLGH